MRRETGIDREFELLFKSLQIDSCNPAHLTRLASAIWAIDDVWSLMPYHAPMLLLEVCLLSNGKFWTWQHQKVPCKMIPTTGQQRTLLSTTVLMS